jgi:hypothetical protein
VRARPGLPVRPARPASRARHGLSTTAG